MIACYGIATSLMLSARGEGHILATAVMPNEWRTLRRIAAFIGAERIVTVIRRPDWGTLLFVGNALLRPRKIWQYVRIVHRINRRYPFMPACRMASTLHYYCRFHSILTRGKWRAVLVTSDYAPDSMGLASCATRLGIATIYAPHAFVPPDSFQPPLRFTLSVLEGRKMQQLYEQKGPIIGEVVYIGIEGTYRPMNLTRLAQHGMRIGIFLSLPVDAEGLIRVISDVRERFSPEGILVRPHPVSIAALDIPKLVTSYREVRVTRGTTLEQDVSACDLAIIGNSSAMLQILRQGVPAIHSPYLESTPPDSNGFVADGIVPSYPSMRDADIAAIQAFYAQPDWETAFKGYDAYYATNDTPATTIRAAVEALA